MPPLAPPKGTSTTAHLKVIRVAKALTSSRSTSALYLIPTNAQVEYYNLTVQIAQVLYVWKCLVCRLGRVTITRHLRIDRARKTASQAFYIPLTVKTQKKSYFSLFLQWFSTMLLQCVKIELKNTQDVSFHVFRINKMRNLFLGASLWWLTPA